jgi:regulator of RNase E activity RraA
MTDSRVQQFAGLGTATISDALDRHALNGTLLGIAPLAEGQHMIGRAYTVRYITAGSPPGTVGDYIDDVQPGEVVVLENAGRMDCTVWGDILTAVASVRGISGTVIDGVCRDTTRAITTGYPIFSRGRFMRTGKDRVEVAAVQEPVTVGGVLVRPGDLLVGDSDGVVAIPQHREAEVLESARMIHDKESSILADALSGSTIAEARKRFGYHDLQKKVNR